MLLREKDMNQLQSIFTKIDADFSVFLFGSRLTNSAHDGSDIDLTLVSDIPLKHETMMHIKDLIQKSSIPVLVEICRFSDLPTWLQNDILNNHIEIYSSKKLAGSEFH